MLEALVEIRIDRVGDNDVARVTLVVVVVLWAGWGVASRQVFEQACGRIFPSKTNVNCTAVPNRLLRERSKHGGLGNPYGGV
jgi:hypothetical protein